MVGEAQTTPEDESQGFMASADDALGQWGSTPAEGFPSIVSGIYSGTAMLNRLLSRKGQRIGAIVTAGQEDYLKFERGIQTYLGYSYSDRLHLATHFHNEPIVPRELMKGVRGRIDVMGEELLPLGRRTWSGRPTSCTRRPWRASSSRCCSPTETPSTRSASGRCWPSATVRCRSTSRASFTRCAATCRG